MHTPEKIGMVSMVMRMALTGVHGRVKDADGQNCRAGRQMLPRERCDFCCMEMPTSPQWHHVSGGAEEIHRHMHSLTRSWFTCKRLSTHGMVLRPTPFAISDDCLKF